MEKTQKIAAKIYSRKNRFRLSTIKVASFSIKLPFFFSFMEASRAKVLKTVKMDG